MKNLSKILKCTTALLAFSLTGSIANAAITYNCTVKEDCAQLGYSTPISECSTTDGTILKCPFDTSLANCTPGLKCPSWQTAVDGVCAVSTCGDLLDQIASAGSEAKTFYITGQSSCPNDTGITLKDGQSIKGVGENPSLGFNFTTASESRGRAIGIELGNNSSLENLKIGFTTAVKFALYKYNSSDKMGTAAAIYSKGKTKTKLKDITLNTHNTSTYDLSYTTTPMPSILIEESSDYMNIDGNVVINITSVKNGEDIYGFYCKDYQTSPHFKLNNGAKLNITTDATFGYAIRGCSSTIDGTLNIKTKQWASGGLMGGKHVISGTYNYITDAGSSDPQSGTLEYKSTASVSAQINVNSALCEGTCISNSASTGFLPKSGSLIVEKGAKMAFKNNEGTVNKQWQAPTNATIDLTSNPEGLKVPYSDLSRPPFNFTTIGSFPGIPTF